MSHHLLNAFKVTTLCGYTAALLVVWVARFGFIKLLLLYIGGVVGFRQ